MAGLRFRKSRKGKGNEVLLSRFEALISFQMELLQKHERMGWTMNLARERKIDN